MIKLELQTDKNNPSGTIYFIPTFIRCRYCDHEIPIGTVKITGMVTCNGGCYKKSSVVDYAEYFGVIKNVG